MQASSEQPLAKQTHGPCAGAHVHAGGLLVGPEQRRRAGDLDDLNLAALGVGRVGQALVRVRGALILRASRTQKCQQRAIISLHCSQEASCCPGKCLPKHVTCAPWKLHADAITLQSAALQGAHAGRLLALRCRDEKHAGARSSAGLHAHTVNAYTQCARIGSRLLCHVPRARAHGTAP